VQDLQVARTPFSKEDINNIKIILADKAPRPDGFSGVSSSNVGASSRKIYISYALIFWMGSWIFSLSTTHLSH
jgi:hypothetical protein